MWISYADSEVNVFHPVCEKALNEALRNLEIDKEYKVIHHQYTGSLEMDFVVQHNSTGKYVCVVEVKRTPSDVHSTRYQFQAMSYVQQNDGLTEKPYYILTNLECAYTFRYNPSKTKAFQQILKPGFQIIGSFERDEKDVFERKLTKFFQEKIEKILKDEFEYLTTLDSFAAFMDGLKKDKKKWKTALAILLYEYIRGSFSYIKRNDLHDIRIFHSNILKICEEAAKVNFKDIFSYFEDKYESNISIESNLIQDMFYFGAQNITGDSIANVLHQVISAGHEHEGEVPTDMELASVVAELASFVNGSLSRNDLICDPAAGSGNLLSAAMDRYDIVPKQILANDWNEQLVELLSLRLGLKYAKSVSKENSSAIFAKNVADLNLDLFENVKIILMNPPFVAGINCVERKEKIFNAINRVSGKAAESNVGQMPLEVPFLELITELVKPGTTIACIFPKTHLIARGLEAKIIRKILLDVFGLRMIFSYPGTEIFDDVTKDTCVVVGKAKCSSEEIAVLSSYNSIPDLDINQFSKALQQELGSEFAPLMPGIMGKKISYNELLRDLDSGWRTLNSEMADAVDFVNETFRDSNLFETMESEGFEMKRGNAGNSGGSDLLFFDSRDDLYNHFQNRGLTLYAGMRNAKLNTLEINGGDSKFLDYSSNRQELINEVVDFYISLPQRKSDKQPRKQKTKQEWLKIIQRESRAKFPKDSVLIPRAIRSTGRVFYSAEPVFVSTNLFVCSPEDKKTAVFLATWMSTIFYQLICEISSKDNEGMRKMEKEDISKTFVPIFSNLSEAFYKKINSVKNNIEFLNLRKIEIREIDKLWADELFGDDSSVILEESARLLSFIVDRRNP